MFHTLLGTEEMELGEDIFAIRNLQSAGEDRRGQQFSVADAQALWKHTGESSVSWGKRS